MRWSGGPSGWWRWASPLTTGKPSRFHSPRPPLHARHYGAAGGTAGQPLGIGGDGGKRIVEQDGEPADGGHEVEPSLPRESIHRRDALKHSRQGLRR